MNADELRAELRQHYGGSETVYHHSLNKGFHYTPGMRSIFQHAGGGAYWLADILATEPKILGAIREHGFCVGVLDVKGTKATLTVARDVRTQEDYHQNAIGYTFIETVYEQAIDYTDFPEGLWRFYLTQTSVGGKSVPMALLDREY